MNPPDFSSLYNPTVAAALVEATRSAPYSRLLGMRVEETGPGRIVCALDVRDDLESGIGAVHGGAIVSLVDHTLSLAVFPLVEPGKWVATVELKVNYLAAVRQGSMRATGTVLSLRNRLAVVRVEVENDGRPVAIGQGTLYVRDRGGS